MKTIRVLEKGKQYRCLKCGRSYAIIPVGYYAIGQLYTWNPSMKAWVCGASPVGMWGWPMHELAPPRFYGMCELVESNDPAKKVPKAIE